MSIIAQIFLLFTIILRKMKNLLRCTVKTDSFEFEFLRLSIHTFKLTTFNLVSGLHR